MKRILLALILSTNLLATDLMTDLAKAPKSFFQNKKNIIFTDFTSVHSKLVFDFDKREALAVSEITFNTESKGYPVFDLVPNIEHSILNGLEVNIQPISSPQKATKYQMVNTEIPAGEHKLIITNKIRENLKFNSGFLSFAFWMSDLTDRRYIEQYLPSNLEFDQYQLVLDIELKGKSGVDEHISFTNGKQIKRTGKSFHIEFPDYFTASSFYLHITKNDRLPMEDFSYKSITGKSIPVTLYGKSKWGISGVQKKTLKYLAELERNFGAWSHPSLVIYIAGMGGMEHSGATITSERALGHELTHSYFARGVMPVNGNSGWMDEAIASWRDKGYKSSKSPNFSSSNMSSHSTYRRFTDRLAYTQGASFMAYLNYRIRDVGGLKSFLNHLHTTYEHKNISTQTFKKEIEIFSGKDFTSEFNRYIFGKNSGIQTQHKSDHNHIAEDPNHPKLSKSQLLDLL